MLQSIQPRHLERCKRRDAKIEEVRKYLTAHLGAAAKEASRDLGIPYNTMRDYFTVIRAEWRGK